ncbi:MAG TPA: radical SAM protein [Thermoanaerobaculia bacterium]|nr:radical SAM protein [Thermoanaerobaculia bacterium]
MNVLDNPTPAATPRTPRAFLTTGVPCRFAAGFYDEEGDALERYRWMGLRGELELPPREGETFLELRLFSELHDLSQEIELAVHGRGSTLPLLHGWATVSVAIPPGAARVTLEANKLFPRAYYPGDGRDLAVRVSTPYLHRDRERHRAITRQYENAVTNLREMLAGAVELRSTPTNLGIDLYGVCNVKPPCVYCEWDRAKTSEGPHVDTPFTTETLAEWAEFYDGASSLVNCSVGEPFMMKNLDQLLDEFGDRGKFLEITTNGQILTDRNIQKLIGRRIQLYVSLDAATAETYAKLRNDRLDDILVNLRRLIAAKGGRAGLPQIFLVFMPMKCNRHELDAFVRLCAELEVDRLVLRPLNYVEAELEWDRAGYHFDYLEELLGFDELVRISARAAALCERLEVPLSDQLDFGGRMSALFETEFARARAELAAADGAGRPDGEAQGPGQASPAAANGLAGPGDSEPAAPAFGLPPDPPAPPPLPSLGAERLPICQEPWKSYYILRRGTMPCCYGADAIAGMSEYRETWNAPLMQELRRELAAGRFHDYCRRSTSCPIVRKEEHAAGGPPERATRLRRVWNLLDRAGAGVPRQILGRIRALRAV